MGDMSTSGNFTALLLHQFGSAWRLKCNVQVSASDCLFAAVLASQCFLQTQQAKWVGYQGTLDYHGTDFTASLTLANPDPIAGSAVAVAQYLQSLTSRSDPLVLVYGDVTKVFLTPQLGPGH